MVAFIGFQIDGLLIGNLCLLPLSEAGIGEAYCGVIGPGTGVKLDRRVELGERFLAGLPSVVDIPQAEIPGFVFRIGCDRGLTFGLGILIAAGIQIHPAQAVVAIGGGRRQLQDSFTVGDGLIEFATIAVQAGQQQQGDVVVRCQLLSRFQPLPAGLLFVDLV
jgi:hypothetical protein